jgi:hypothetical protein
MQSRALGEKLAGAKERNKRRICPLFQLVPPSYQSQARAYERQLARPVKYLFHDGLIFHS